MSDDASQVISLYQEVLDRWNRRAADEFGAVFADDGNLVGFDGSQINGRSEVAWHLRQIFADHPTAAFVGKVREVRFLTPEVAILRAVAGMSRRASRTSIGRSTPSRRWSRRSMQAHGGWRCFTTPRPSFTDARS